MAKSEVYVSTDVEADGPIPGPHSMLSFASVAFDANGQELGSFARNLEQLDGATGHPDTMRWWAEQQAAWHACRTNPLPAESAMKEYVAWLDNLAGHPVFVGYPVAYDFSFVYWYLMRFVGKSPFGHSALDIKTYAMALLDTPYRGSTKRNMPKRWFPATPHTHVSIDDAREQGLLFTNMLRERQERDRQGE
ncbi:MAG TPA: hypothetical protein VIV60_24755 [Polyangiaceae bacterium]